MGKTKGKVVDAGVGASGITADGPFASGDITRFETLMGEIGLSIDTDTVETSGYGSDFQENEIITYNWSVDINAYYQVDASPNTDDLLVAWQLALDKRAFVMWPNGKPAGEADATHPRYSGRTLLSSLSISPPRNNVVTLRGRLQGDGALHRSTS